MAETTYAWAPITKSELQDDGTLMVYGPAADAGLDRDRQRCDQAWLDQAMPAWLAEGGNVREQHDPQRAAGVGVGLSKTEDGAHLLAACVVDPVSVKKCLPGPNGRPPVLKGFSIGVREPRLEFGKADAPNGLIVGGKIIEVSLVDRPSNPRATFAIAKADGAGELQAVENPEVVELDDDQDEDSDEAAAPAADGTADEAVKADKPAGTMPNAKGAPSYPINSKADLRKAIRAVGRGGADHDAIRRHIMARAKALGLTSMIPNNWAGSLTTTKAEDTAVADQDQVDTVKAEHAAAGEKVLARVRELLPDLAKADGMDTAEEKPAVEGGDEDEASDIAGAHEAIARIAALIVSEAQSLAAGNVNEAYDISCLLDAVSALKWFICREEEEAEAMQAAATKADAPDDVPAAPVVEPAPDTTPEPAPQEAVNEAADAAKVDAAAGMLTKADVAELVKAQVAQVTQAAEEREKGLRSEIDALKAEVDKALALPMPGGPVLTRTAAQDAAARVSDAEALRVTARSYLVKADQTSDPHLSRGYRDLARQHQEKADALT